MLPANSLETVEEQSVSDGKLHLKNVDELLGGILRSSRFKDSVQLQTLLRYVVEEALKGNDDALKERIIGIVVFGRKPDYDTADDPIVRSRMGLLRKRLAQYYEGDEAGNTELQIVIPNGTYRPTFVFRPGTHNGKNNVPTQLQSQLVVPHEIEEARENERNPPVPGSSRAARWRIWGVTAVMSCALLLAIWVGVTKWQKSELSLLWSPILESNKTVILYIGTITPAYLSSGDPSDRTIPSSDQELPASGPLPSPVVRPNSTASNFVLIPEGLAPPGDITADLKIAALMNTYNRNLSLRTRPNLPFIDMQGSPIVLIGAYDNYWTLNLAQDLPFFFDRGGRIRERGGQHRVWHNVPKADDSTISEDYAVVFRLLDAKTGGPVIAIGGLTTCGTQAAADFVTDSVQLKKLSSISRNALERKNLEFVLRASLVNCTPTSVDIVAQKVW